MRESKIIWEHLRQHDNVPSRTLALEEMMTMAQGHFKEVRLQASEWKGGRYGSELRLGGRPRIEGEVT